MFVKETTDEKEPDKKETENTEKTETTDPHQESYNESDQELSFVAVKEDGTTQECDALLLLQGDDNDKHYIVYTDYTEDEEKAVSVFASIYKPEELKSYIDGQIMAMPLYPIETQEEWTMIDEAIKKAMQEEE